VPCPGIAPRLDVAVAVRKQEVQRGEQGRPVGVRVVVQGGAPCRRAAICVCGAAAAPYSLFPSASEIMATVASCTGLAAAGFLTKSDS